LHLIGPLAHSKFLNHRKKTITAKLIAKSQGVWAADAGLKALEILSAEMGMPLTIKSQVHDGEMLESKKVLCEWSGATSSVLVFERHLH
jgi:nicotinate-nucleotide pyrophosphorylase